jgi:carbamoyl-phosphate synthase large subunit
LLVGARLAELELPSRADPTRAWAKEPVFPTERFPGATNGGPEMRSTGEVMGGGRTPSEAYARALRAAGRGRRAGAVGASLQSAGEEFDRATAGKPSS